MSKLIELYLEANNKRYGRYQTKEEFMKDMRNKEHHDRFGHGDRTVCIMLEIGIKSKGREHIQEQWSFMDLEDIYDSIMIKKEATI